MHYSRAQYRYTVCDKWDLATNHITGELKPLLENQTRQNCQPEVVCFSLSKPGAYIAHNATVQLVICLCYAVANVANVASSGLQRCVNITLFFTPHPIFSFVYVNAVLSEVQHGPNPLHCLYSPAINEIYTFEIQTLNLLLFCVSPSLLRHTFYTPVSNNTESSDITQGSLSDFKHPLL